MPYEDIAARVRVRVKVRVCRMKMYLRGARGEGGAVVRAAAAAVVRTVEAAVVGAAAVAAVVAAEGEGGLPDVEVGAEATLVL